ncbi:uncharacterized protein LOC144752615 [Lissotriton helveticus]
MCLTTYTWNGGFPEGAQSPHSVTGIPFLLFDDCDAIILTEHAFTDGPSWKIHECQNSREDAVNKTLLQVPTEVTCCSRKKTEDSVSDEDAMSSHDPGTGRSGCGSAVPREEIPWKEIKSPEGVELYQK